MSASDLGPLDWRMGIVDKAGRPTPEFQRKWEAQRLNNTLIGTTLGSGAPPVSPVPEDGKEYVDTSTTPWTLYVAQGGTWTKVGVYKFTDLTDAPHDYTTNANKLLQVKATEDGLQFGTLTSVLDSIGSVRGDILYRGPTSWTVLAPGTSGQVLKTGGAGADPSWGTAGVTPGGTTGQLQYNNGGTLGGVTVGGDGTLNTTTGSLIVTKTNGVSFAPSATTDTTNASNISSGTLAAARGGAGTVNGILQANGSGAVSAVTIGSGLSYSSGVLTATGSSGLANPSTLGTVTFQQITGVPSNSLPMGSLSLRSDLPRAYLSQTPSTAIPSRVQEVSACGTYTATLPGTPTTGNFLVAMCGHGSVQPVANTGWTEISHHSQTSLEGYVTLLYKQVGASEPAIQTPCSGTPGAQGSVGIVEVSGIGTWSSSFQSGVYGLGGATISGTTPLANCLLLTFASWWGTGAVPSMSQGSAGWTHQVSTNTGGASIQMTASQPTTTSGTAYSSSMTTSAWSNQMTESVVVLAPSTGGGIGPVPLSILTTLKSGGSTVTSYAQSINFGTGLTATDDGQGNTTVNATGGGGTGGGYVGSMVPIREVITSGSQTSVTISSIPSTYRDLKIVVTGRGTAAAGNINLNLQFNGDSGTNYEWQQLNYQGGTNFTGGTTTVSQIVPGLLPAASASSLAAGTVDMTIANYAGTTFHKDTISLSGAQAGSTGSTMFTIEGYGRWKNTAAITSVTLTPSSGAFVDGTVITVYGIGGTAGNVAPVVIPCTRLVKNTAQSCAANTWTQVTWDTTAARDDVSAFNGATPTYITVPNGYTQARVTLHTIWANVSGGNRFAQIIINGVAQSVAMSVGQNESGSMCSTGWVSVAAGQQISAFVLQNTGGAVNFSPATGFSQAFLEVEWGTSAGVTAPSTVIGAASLSTTQTPSVNFYIMTYIMAPFAFTINKLAFAANTTTAGCTYKPFIYADTTGSGPGTLLGSGAQVTGVTVGYNEAPLSSGVTVTKGQGIWVGLNVTGAAVANMLSFSGGISAYAGNGGSNTPASTAPGVTYVTSYNGIYGIWGVN